MSKIIRYVLIFIILGFSHTLLSQNSDDNIKTYSYKEFVDMIHAVNDSIFRLNDAVIEYDENTDSDFLIVSHTGKNYSKVVSINKIINKEFVLDNVQFMPYSKRLSDTLAIKASLSGFTFKRRVSLNGIYQIHLGNNIFEDEFSLGGLGGDAVLNPIIRPFGGTQYHIDMWGNEFNSRVWFQSFVENSDFDLTIWLGDNKFKFNPAIEPIYFHSIIYTIGTNTVILDNNEFFPGQPFSLIIQNPSDLRIDNNKVNNHHFKLHLDDLQNTHYFTFTNNDFNEELYLNISNLNESFQIDWDQFKAGLLSVSGYGYALEFNKEHSWIMGLNPDYSSKLKYENEKAFKEEIKLRSRFYKYYKVNFDTKNANSVIVNIKDFESQRMEYVYRSNPSFNIFFKWKINKFLKVFSNYGTEPQRAIIFSFYVILLFALIYLFFPNTWDEHGRKRIMDRYTFFIKYMKSDAGIHEVYLEEKEDDLLEYEEFKTVMEESGRAIPKFFLATGYPLYKWAVLGTSISAKWLKRFDIMSGKWTDLPKKKRLGKSVLLIGAFILALAYDLFIKVLNAVMLSVNTFTTLGFGEIPIKGLPRYLAIIQGFIGWFMLTIFSVSLISQLLLN